MTKYIDADKLGKYIADGLNNPNKKEAFGFDAVQILSEIYVTPTADVQEVIRCKDCKFRYTGTCFARHETANDDYCSNGVRKDGDEK